MRHENSTGIWNSWEISPALRQGSQFELLEERRRPLPSSEMLGSLVEHHRLPQYAAKKLKLSQPHFSEKRMN